MVKRRNQTNRKKRSRKGFCEKRPKPRKINASTAYETCSEQLSPFGGLLPLIKFIDLVGFREIFHFAYRPPSRDPKLGHYPMMMGILMLLFIGFNRIYPSMKMIIHHSSSDILSAGRSLSPASHIHNLLSFSDTKFGQPVIWGQDSKSGTDIEMKTELQSRTAQNSRFIKIDSGPIL